MALWEALAELPQLATGLNNLAKLYVARAQFDKAEPLCRRALEAQARASGAESPGIAEILDTGLGSVHGQSRYTWSRRILSTVHARKMEM